MRLALIGNSHLAAVKAGADAHPEVLEACDVTMFGARGGSLTKPRVEGSVIRIRDADGRASFLASAGVEDIEIDMFDAVCLVGLGLGPSAYVSAASHVAEGHYLSSGLESSLLQSTFDCGSARFGTAVRRISGEVPLAMVAEPVPAAGELERDSRQGKVYALARKFDLGHAPLQRFNEETAVWAQSSFISDFIPQPAATVDDDGLTAEVFNCNGANWRGLDRGTSARDYRHMNADYGALVLHDIAAWLQSKDLI